MLNSLPVVPTFLNNATTTVYLFDEIFVLKRGMQNTACLLNKSEMMPSRV